MLRHMREGGRQPSETMRLLDLDQSNIDLAGIQLMTCDFIKGTEGHYMPRASFLNLIKYERIIEMITLFAPIH